MTRFELETLKEIIYKLRDYQKDVIPPPDRRSYNDGWLDVCNELLFFIHQHENTL